MTLTQFVARSAFRNKRRSLFTAMSIGFSLLLLTLMMTIYRSFYLDEGTPDAAQRLIIRHKVSLTFFLPLGYRERIRTVPGVLHVVPMNWFGGKYKDDRPENFFAQFTTDANEIFKVHTEWRTEPTQLNAWQHDRASACVSDDLVKKYGWKIGDRVNLIGTIYPINPELTLRCIYTAPDGWNGLLFHDDYLQEGVRWFKGRSDMFSVLVDTPEDVPRVAEAIDSMNSNSPFPTKTETEKAFQLGFIAMMGNVKAFILGISGAVVFAILLVSANTMAMSIRERIREVAVLKVLGFTRRKILAFFVGEAVVIALAGGVLGIMAANGLVYMVSHSPAGQMTGPLSVTGPTLGVALLVATVVGFFSAVLPAYRASQLNIAEGLRHLG
jgi:putative ABC transport system permease protein